MKKYTQEIRFLLTQQCTHECFFCHSEGMSSNKEELLDVDDICFIFNTARLYFGFGTTTLSGGEPLIRKDVIDIAKRSHGNLCKTTITTNGVLLNKRIYIGNYIDRINVSLHSLNEAIYEKITGRKNAFNVVIYGLQKFRSYFPSLDIRLNTTLIRGLNDDEKSINELLSFSSKLGASIKFIEMYPNTLDYYVSVDVVEEILVRQNFVPIISTTRKKNYYNGMLEVGLTKIFCAETNKYPDQKEFCFNNNDLFVAPDGTITPCRHRLDKINILEETKNRDIEGLYKKILSAYSILTDCNLI